jgi:hypothetical protein
MLLTLILNQYYQPIFHHSIIPTFQFNINFIDLMQNNVLISIIIYIKTQLEKTNNLIFTF